jgi:hypothetical protein
MARHCPNKAVQHRAQNGYIDNNAMVAADVFVLFRKPTERTPEAAKKARACLPAWANPDVLHTARPRHRCTRGGISNCWRAIATPTTLWKRCGTLTAAPRIRLGVHHCCTSSCCCMRPGHPSTMGSWLSSSSLGVASSSISSRGGHKPLPARLPRRRSDRGDAARDGGWLPSTSADRPKPYSARQLFAVRQRAAASGQKRIRRRFGLMIKTELGSQDPTRRA